MNTTIALPRLPREMTSGGASVAVRLPFGDRSVAHRVVRTNRAVVNAAYSQLRQTAVVVAACAPDDEPCAELSAGWADHRGAQACGEPACFPTAEPR